MEIIEYDDHAEIIVQDVNGNDVRVSVSLGKLDMVRNINWTVNKKGYVVSRSPVSMHRLITGAPRGMLVDHDNRKKYDNTDDNLKVCNTSQNTINSGLSCTNTSGHKGVSWNSKKGQWQARITRDGVTRHLGWRNIKEDAVRLRLDAEEEYNDCNQ